MDENLKLTNAERSIMECLWNSEHGLTFKGLIDCMSEKFDKVWKKQTLSTYINSLQKAGLIKSDSRRRPYIYRAACTKDDFLHNQTAKLIEEEYSNSLSNFIAAFVGGQKLPTNEVQELRNLLDQLCQDDPDSGTPID